MKKTIRLTESNLIKMVRRILKEEGEEEVIISPEEYIDLLRKVFFQAQGIPKLSKFRGKKLVINGNLNLSKFNDEKMLTDLGNIKINGDLDISHTNIKSLDNVEVTGYPRIWQTPWETELNRRKTQRELGEAEERREEDVWNLDNTDTEGEKANVAFDYAVQQGLLKARMEDEDNELKELKIKLSELKTQMEQEEDEERYDELSSEFDEIQERVDELEGEYTDVYDLIPDGTHFELTSFRSISEGFTISVGTEDEADESMKDNFRDFVESPQEYLDKNTISYHLDGDKIADEYEDMIEEWVRESPESYDVDKDLSSDQEEEIWILEMEKYIYENTNVRFPIKYQTKENGNVFDFEDGESNRFQYYEEGGNWVLDKDGVRVDPNKIYDDENTSDQQDDKESRISDIEYEIEGIKENPDGDPDESSVEQAVQDRLYDIKRDPLGFLEDMGYDFEGMINFIDKDDLLESLIRDSDYGALSGYDSNYDDFNINGTVYIVVRTD